jgi:hypothetical protein
VGTAEDVAADRIGQRPEQQVGGPLLVSRFLIYNHLVVS